jgi:hypothetical protein
VKGQTANQISIDKIEVDQRIDDSVFKMPAKPGDKPNNEEKNPPASYKPSRPSMPLRNSSPDAS